MSYRLERRLGADELGEQLRREAREGLTAAPKFMRSRWVWDARGAELYDRIMELPQYYLPQVERPLLAAHAADVEALVHPRRAVELGPGSSVKTPLVLDALTGLESYVAIDVSEEALEAAGRRLAERYADLDIVGIVADFESGLPEPAERTLVICLGSTVGNMGPGERATLLVNVAQLVGEDGALLLGLDLVKDPARIAGAYQDEIGYTDGLISNLLTILNRELGADFDVARFRPEAEWLSRAKPHGDVRAGPRAADCDRARPGPHRRVRAGREAPHRDFDEVHARRRRGRAGRGRPSHRRLVDRRGGRVRSMPRATGVRRGRGAP